MSDSLFRHCTSHGAGGAIYCFNCETVRIHSCTFRECVCPDPDTSAGGAFIYQASLLPETTANTFISCSGGQDCGGLYLYETKGGTRGENLPVKECRFIGCIAYGKSPQSTKNEADAGGLRFWMNDYTLGISESLFSKCESKERAGGSFLAVNSIYFHNIIRFCFYSQNTAPHGNNALVHFNGSSTNLWSIVFFHSFTSDNSITNSLVQNFSDATPVTSNWFIQKTIHLCLTGYHSISITLLKKKYERSFYLEE